MISMKEEIEDELIAITAELDWIREEIEMDENEMDENEALRG